LGNRIIVWKLLFTFYLRKWNILAFHGRCPGKGYADVTRKGWF